MQHLVLTLRLLFNSRVLEIQRENLQLVQVFSLEANVLLLELLV